MGCDGPLANMRSRRMDSGVKGYRSTEQRFKSHCSGKIGKHRDTQSSEQSQSTHSGHRLCPIQECKSLFRGETNRLDSSRTQSLASH